MITVQTSSLKWDLKDFLSLTPHIVFVAVSSYTMLFYWMFAWYRPTSFLLRLFDSDKAL